MKGKEGRGPESAQRNDEEIERRRKSGIRIVVTALVVIFTVIAVIVYLSLTSASDTGATAMGACMIIAIIVGVIAFELLMKPQIALYNPEAYLVDEPIDEKGEEESKNDEGKKQESK